RQGLGEPHLPLPARRPPMKRLGFLLVFIAGIGIAAYGGYRFALKGNHEEIKSQTERQVLYWYDPMVPQQRFDKPGKSPFMDMQLVPKYADEPASGAGVKVNSQLAQNLG